jgi:2-polyprenyl-6-methoxyphenol hydroxylase-like FAD-dependent oxidoreductase
MSEHTTCAVVGGGPAGIVLGLLLARAGVDVTVLEKHGDFLRDFRGDTVHPTTLALLADLGLAERFEKLPYSKVDRLEFPGPDGGPVVAGDFTHLPSRYRYVAMVPQWDLLDMLGEAAAEEPTFHLRMNTEAIGVIAERGAVVGVRYRDEHGQEGELRADLTVAADGRWSAVRRSAGLTPHEYPVPVDAWWFRLSRRSTDTEAGLTAQAGERAFAVQINRTEYFQIAYLAAKGLDPLLRAEGLDAFRARIAELVPSFADRVGEITDLSAVKHLDVRLNRLPTWHRDGLLCIGDAAHAMSPIGGVGINLAVQDAVAAATLLAAPLRAHTLARADLAKVQRRRLLPTVAVQAMQRFLHRILLRPVIDGTRAGLPPAAVAVLRRVPVARLVPAYLVGIGFRPERAPDFARRPAARVR